MPKTKSRKVELLIIAEVLSLILLIPAMLQKNTVIWEGTQAELYGEEIQLSRGISAVDIELSSPAPVDSVVSVDKQTVSYYGVLCNDIFISKGQSKVSFEIYVIDKVATVQFHVLSEGQDITNQVQAQIRIYETCKKYSVLFLLLLLLYGVVDLLMLFRQRVLSGVIDSKGQVSFFVLAGGTILTMAPLFVDYIFFGADGDVHILRIESLAKSIESGSMFPNRLNADCIYDHGYAFSLFYPDLFLYIPALLRVAGFTIMSAYKFYVIMIQMLTAFICYRSLGYIVRKRSAATIGTLIYLFNPYRLYNIYGRGAIGEYTAMAFMPLIAAAIYLLLTEEASSKGYKRIKYLLMLGMTGVMESHVLSTELVIIFLVLIAIVHLRRTLRKETIVQIMEAAVLTLMVNLFFWVPLIYMMRVDRYVFHQTLVTGIQDKGTTIAAIFQLIPNRGGAQTGMYMAEPIQIGIAGLIIASMSVVMLCKYGTRNGHSKAILHTLLLLAFLSFMGTKYFPWDSLARIPVIGFCLLAIQFPTRIFAFAAVAIAILTAFFVLRVEEVYKERSRVRNSIIVGCCILSILGGVFFLDSTLMTMDAIHLYNRDNFAKVSLGSAEYLLEGSRLSDYSYHEPVMESGILLNDYTKDGLTVHAKVENQTSHEQYIDFPLTGYKLYRLLDENNTKKPPRITEVRGAHGDLRVAIPGGYKGDFTIEYHSPIVFQFATYISEITAVLLALGLIDYEVKKKHK